MTSRSRCVALAACAALLAIAATARSEEPADPARPRIGLCLAGGGARGGAHVGVLKVLEELRVPVDYIAGTSIGSIVGGLYASGYSPEELQIVITTVDWGAVFKDTPPREEIEYRRKAEDRLPYWGLEVGVNRGKVRIASGLIAGQKLNFLLRRLTLHTTGIDDFDQLAVPFRAVAADLSDGSMVVLDHGALADALRASMAIPGAFTPQEIDGRLMVDGGMVRNLPYDVVKAMGADVVIGVDVSTPVGALGQDPSFLGVVSRTLDLATKVNVGVSRQQFTTDDVLMTPDLRDVTTASFPKMGDAARYGEEIARVNLERLRAFSVSNEEYAAWRAHQRAGRRGMQPTVGQVRVATDGRVDVRRVRPRVETRPDAPLDLDVLQDDLTRVYRIGEFESVDFRLDRTAGGSTADLVITTREKSWGPNYLRFGLSLVDHFDGNASYNLLFYHRRANLNALGAEWRNQLVLGDHFVLDSEFYQPVAYSGQWFVAPRFLLELDKFKTFTASGTGVNADRDRWQGRLDLGRTFSVWGELRLGAYSGRVKGGTEDSIEAADFDAQEGGWSAALAFDRLDNIDFPRRGWSAVARGKLSRDALGADDAYDRAWTELRAATSTGRMTFVGRFEGGTSFESTLPVYDRFELGGFTRLSGLEPRQLQGDEYFLAALGGYVRVASIGAPLGGNIYAGLLAETGRTWLSEVALSADRLRAGGSAFLGAETLLGPVYLGYGWTDGGDDSLYFYLGRVF